jgi:hypothetical protein
MIIIQPSTSAADCFDRNLESNYARIDVLDTSTSLGIAGLSSKPLQHRGITALFATLFIVTTAGAPCCVNLSLVPLHILVLVACRS